MGIALPRILKKWDDSAVTNVFAVSQEEFEKEDSYLVSLTKKGFIKRTPLALYQSVRANGLNALTLQEGDTLGWVQMSTDDDAIILASKFGQMMRFNLATLRPQGRVSRGVHAMKLADGDTIAGMDIIPRKGSSKASLLVVTSLGQAKRVPLTSYKAQARNGAGVKGVKLKAPPCVSMENASIAITVREPCASLRHAARALALQPINRACLLALT